MRRDPCIEVQHGSHDGAEYFDVWAGNDGQERIVPPAGEEYAFTRTKWRRHVQVYVSPTGRSVRVFVDGEEVKR